jgi:hypothetical protein
VAGPVRQSLTGPAGGTAARGAEPGLVGLTNLFTPSKPYRTAGGKAAGAWDAKSVGL